MSFEDREIFALSIYLKFRVSVNNLRFFFHLSYEACLSKAVCLKMVLAQKEVADAAKVCNT